MARKILIKNAQLINEGRAFSSDVRRAMSSGVSRVLSTNTRRRYIRLRQLGRVLNQ